MKNIFEHTLSSWVKYSSYEIKEDSKGTKYVTATDNSMPSLYSITDNSDKIVIDALNVGLICMKSSETEKAEKAILDFVSDYGLLGIMTSITATPSFMDYEAVYLIKNRFIKSERMDIEKYLSIFFPFEKPDIVKDGIESKWNISGDRTMIALALTFGNMPTGFNLSVQRIYAEPLDWLKKQFADLATTFYALLLYYDKENEPDERTKELYRQSITAFNGVAPTYHIAFTDTPKLVWDFQSLSLAIQLMFNIMATDTKKPLRICKYCAKAFKASRPSAVFCSPGCKNKYNVYKSRAKDKED